MSPAWLSADDIAAHLGVTKDTVYSWIADKAMPAHKVGRLWKFQTSEVDEWVRTGGAAASGEGPPARPSYWRYPVGPRCQPVALR